MTRFSFAHWSTGAFWPLRIVLVGVWMIAFPDDLVVTHVGGDDKSRTGALSTRGTWLEGLSETGCRNWGGVIVLVGVTIGGIVVYHARRQARRQRAT
jgi:hypothetical protein